jgi:flagellar biosynthesis/type III secretory pathway chaperone
MNPDVRRRLDELLDREIALAHELTGILAAEKAALVGAAPQAVLEQVQVKVQLFQEIEKLDVERRALCADPASGLGDALAARWRTLTNLLIACRTANELNGHIIHARQFQIRQLIDVVRGGPAPIIYDPQGKTSTKAHRALARA